MRNVTLTIYTYEELSTEAKAKAIEKHRDVNTFDEWWQFLHDDFVQRIADCGFAGKTFYWSLDGQERGIWCDDMSVADLSKVLLKAGIEPAEKILTEDYVTLYFRGSRNRNRQNRFLVMEDDKEERERIEGALNGFLCELFGGFLKDLDAEYESLTSDEAVAETMVANEYEFVVSGERWPVAWG
jgi:hypothetical protein